MNWAPRWLNAYYDQSDALRKILFAGCTYHLDKASYHFQAYTRSSFYGYEGESRAGYLAKYHFPSDYVPPVVLVCADPQLITTTVYEADTWGSFMYEELHPVFYRDPQGALYFKNLNVVHYQVTAVSGYIDLSTQLAQHPRVADSPIILANGWDDRQIIDPIDTRLNNTTLKVIQEGVYDVYWHSTRLHTALMAASAYITIGGEQVTLVSHTLENSWDVGGRNPGLYRWDREANNEFKTRLQHYALSSKPETQISSVLGESRTIVWSPQSSWSLAGSGSIRLEPLGLQQYEYREEFPILFNSVFLLSQTPSGVVQVFYNLQAVDSSEYSITGNVLMPLTTRLQEARQGQILVRYRVINYTMQTSGWYITTIGPGNYRPDLKYVMVARKVRFVRNVRRVKTWRWGSSQQGVTGNAAFG